MNPTLRPAKGLPGALARIRHKRSRTMRTVRFVEVVEASGKPEVYLPLVPPDEDKALQRAVKAGRVMTVHQENTGHHADFGEIGLKDPGQGQVLVFPKSLRKYDGVRVVGIRYPLVVGNTPERPNRKTVRKAAPPRPPVAKAEPKAESVAHPAPAKKVKAAPAPSMDDGEPETEIRAILTQVAKAVAELEAGRQVAAYNLLKKVVEQHPSD